MGEASDKEVHDALRAIKKLVELNGADFDDDKTIVTLDHVVWRNPVSDAAEDNDDVLSLDTSHLLAKTLENRPMPSADAKAAPSSHGDDLNAKPVEHSAAPPQADSDETTMATSRRQATFADAARTPQPDQSGNEKISPAASASVSPRDITDLGVPIARRGGGLYANKPVIPTSQSEPDDASPVMSQSLATPQISPQPVSPQQTHVHELDEPQISPSVSSVPQENREAANRIEPPLPHDYGEQDFAGYDFSFAPTEGLMSPVSLRELSDSATPPIAPEIAVPLADPPVADPVREAQMLFIDEDNEAEAEFEAPISQPNLHIVSDQTAYETEEDEGFSGTVKTALRAIIKEQVSSWLHNNMTDLIEEALSGPPQRQISSSKKSKTPSRKRDT